MSYELSSTDYFDRALAKLDKPMRERVTSEVNKKLGALPYRNTTSLSGFPGLRSMHVGKCRVILAIVEEVRKLGLESKRPELECHGLPGKTIKLIDVGFRKNIYDR